MTLALLVDFEIQPAQADAFAAAIAENARISVRDEPGCQRFDVCRDPAAPQHFFLYELYDDAAAIQAHLQSAHFQSFNTLTMPWVIHKRARTQALLPA